MLTFKQLKLITCLAVVTLMLTAAVRVCAADAAAQQPAKTGAQQPVDGQVLGTGTADKGGDDFLSSLNAEDKKIEEKEPPLYVTALGFIFRFALVLGLAYGTILALKRFGNIRGGFAATNRKYIRVLENSTLGTNRALHVVEVGSRKFLVASTPNSVSLISELRDSDLPEVTAPEAPSPEFKDQLQAFLGNKTDSTNAAKSVAVMLRESSTFVSGKVMEMGKLRRKFRNGE